MNYREPAYNRFGTIDCEINHPLYGWIPFTCDPKDKGALFDTKTLYDKMKPHAAPYIPPPPLSKEEMEAEIRAKRDILLVETDWTQLPDVPTSTRERWASYRQSLRDITDQPGFPETVVWPTKP
jgi:hypothetical protein